MNIFKSIFTYQCPRCRSYKMFVEPFNFTDPLKMHDRCKVCDQNFEPEPGFYFGAMFMSYIVSGFLYLIPALILVFVFGWSANSAMGFVIFIAVVTYFKLMRTARAIWIHIAVGYDKKYEQKT